MLRIISLKVQLLPPACIVPRSADLMFYLQHLEYECFSAISPLYKLLQEEACTVNAPSLITYVPGVNGCINWYMYVHVACICMQYSTNGAIAIHMYNIHRYIATNTFRYTPAKPYASYTPQIWIWSALLGFQLTGLRSLLYHRSLLTQSLVGPYSEWRCNWPLQ